MIDRVVGRLRRQASELVRVGSDRPWVVTIGDAATDVAWLRPDRSPLFGWWVRRGRWSPTVGALATPTGTTVVYLHVGDWRWLRSFAADPVAARTARVVHVRVEAWRPPTPGWSGRLGPLPGVIGSDVRLPARGTGPVGISVTLADPLPLREVIAAALDVLSPGRPVPATLTPAIGVTDGLPVWLWPGPGALLRVHDAAHLPMSAGDADVDGSRADDPGALDGAGDRAPDGAGDPILQTSLPAVDAELRLDGTGFPRSSSMGSARSGSMPDGTLRVTMTGIETSDGPLSLIDLRGMTIRRRPHRDGPVSIGHLRLRVDAGDTSHRDGGSVAWSITTLGAGPVWRSLLAPFDSQTLAMLLSITGITCLGLDTIAAADAASLLVRLAVAGVVLDASDVPGSVLSRLTSELRDIISEPLPDTTAERIEWQIRSVRQRRAAMRGHGTSLALPALLRPDATPAAAPPSVTALLVTRRPGHAVHALAMLAAQTYPVLEVIVGLHGVDRTDDLDRAVATMPIPTRLVEIPAASRFGEAMAVATAHAAGTFVTKVDDDDLYGPEHVWDLILGRATSGATVVGKAAEFVTFDQSGITIRRHGLASDTYDRSIAGGTIMVPRGELEALGGWRPVRSALDRGFLERVTDAGGLVFRTWPVGFIYRRHGHGHTWGRDDDYFLRSVSQRWDGLPPYAEFGAGARAATPADTDPAA